MAFVWSRVALQTTRTAGVFAAEPSAVTRTTARSSSPDELRYSPRTQAPPLASATDCRPRWPPTYATNDPGIVCLPLVSASEPSVSTNETTKSAPSLLATSSRLLGRASVELYQWVLAPATDASGTVTPVLPTLRTNHGAFRVSGRYLSVISHTFPGAVVATTAGSPSVWKKPSIMVEFQVGSGWASEKRRATNMSQ